MVKVEKGKIKKGDWVAYINFDGTKEYGIVKSWNDQYVLVVYQRPGRDMNLYENYTAVATKWDDLYK